MLKPTRATILLLALGVAACRPRGGTDVGNGATATFDLGAYKPSATTTSAKPKVVASGATVERFYISVGDFRLKGGATCEGGRPDAITADGPLVGDLIAEDAASPSEPVELPSGNYCGMFAESLPVSQAELPGAGPGGDEEVSVFVAGQRRDGTPFTIVSSRAISFRLDAPSSKPFTVEGEVPFVVAFDVDGAIAAVDLDALEGSVIVVDEKTNTQALAAFEKSLKSSASLFLDDDDDGVLSEDESTVDRTLARGQP